MNKVDAMKVLERMLKNDNLIFSKREACKVAIGSLRTLHGYEHNLTEFKREYECSFVEQSDKD